jgi:hypothetical protein
LLYNQTMSFVADTRSEARKIWDLIYRERIPSITGIKSLFQQLFLILLDLISIAMIVPFSWAYNGIGNGSRSPSLFGMLVFTFWLIPANLMHLFFVAYRKLMGLADPRAAYITKDVLLYPGFEIMTNRDAFLLL